MPLLELLNNWVLWAILLLAVVCYALLFSLLLTPPTADEQQRHWLSALPVLLSALPLLGLFGTIAGLMQSFRMLASSDISQQGLLGNGIADALITTQAGLLMVIPGWLLLAWVKSRYHKVQDSDEN